jgi:signal transduction histidine kinase
MMWLFRLRVRLAIAYTSLILIGFGGLALVAGRQISTAAKEDFEHRAESEVALLAQALKEPVEHYLEGEVAQADVTQVLNDYSEETGGEIALINNTGKVWLTSTGDMPENSYLGYPEIVTAFERRTTHETRYDEDNQLKVFTAAPIAEDGRIISIVQLTVPMDQLQDSIRQRWLALIGGVLGLGLATIVISMLISASLTRPLEQLKHSALRLADGDFSQRLPTHRRDEIGQVAITFNAMVERVQAMIEEQRTFASNASHELRTPLTAIQLRSEALKSNEHLDEDTQRRYITEIDDESRRMGELINDLILLSRLDVGSAALGDEHIDLGRFARHLVEELSAEAEKNGVQLSLDCPKEIGMMPIRANLTHLRVVFRNVVENAIKYTSENGSSVEWAIRTEGEWVISTIKDTGRGIDVEELEHVVKRFYRADKSHSRQIQGTGLGLPLVNSIVEAYGGKFRIESRGIGHGTTVSVYWKALKNGDSPI